jgi:Mrp family chromosome partitioning ATPase/capsular polysaccharide biosynthesis protein
MVRTESELPLTFREILSSLWRRRLTIAITVVIAVVAALAYSKVQTPKYQSSALVQENGITASAAGGQSSPVTLPDPVQELGSTAVQQQAAKILGHGTAGSVAADVTGTVDSTTGQLDITATDADPARAQAVAKAYSEAYVDQIQALIQVQVDKIQTELTSLQHQIGALQASNPSGTDSVITAQITGLTTTLSTLQSQLTSIQFGEPYASIQVAAGLPGSPSGIGQKKLLAIGIIAGLLAGCGIALARDRFDDRLRNSPDLDAITDAPVLAELPQDSDVRSGAVTLAMVQAPQSQMAEAVRELRTSLRVVLHDSPCPVITVTSPEAGDGKTFVAANLAAAWAMSGSKVIVVSADFRRPRLEEVFGLPLGGRPGLADLIRHNWQTPEPSRRPAGRREFQAASVQSASVKGASVKGPGRTPDRPTNGAGSGRDVELPGMPEAARSSAGSRGPSPFGDGDAASVAAHLVDSGIWGLQILPAGIQLDNPAELFGSPGMQPVIDQLRLLADVILVDTPPVLVAPDTAIIGSFTRGAIVVAAEGKTDRSDLERTVHRLETTNCRVLGVALNRVRRASASAYQAYAYRP